MNKHDPILGELEGTFPIRTTYHDCVGEVWNKDGNYKIAVDCHSECERASDHEMECAEMLTAVALDGFKNDRHTRRQ